MEGTRPSPELSETSLPLLRGELPESLRGTYFVVSAVGSPTQTSLQIPRKAPVLNGDGVVYALEFGEEGVKGRARLVENASFVADELVAHAKPGEPGSSFSFCDAGLTRVGGTKLGVRSQSNTALTPFRARGPQSRPLILAGYDAGRPEVIDPCTLKALGPVGSTDLWFSQAFSGSPFPLLFSGAHPVVAHEDGELFMANYQRSFLPGLSSLNQVLLRAGFGVRGGLEGVQPLDTEGFLDAMIASVPREEQERVSSREYDEEACAELVRGVEELEGAEGSLESLERLRIPGIDLLWDLATRAVLDVLKQLRKMGLPTLNPEVYLLRRSSEGLDRFKV
ncbi:MAG: carotenoid oxygenase family protein, partial [Myxococcota bacterium]